MILAALLWAVLACGAFVLAAMGGWLGPDIGVGSGFCEAARDCWMAQPANTASNLGFVLAGLAIAWHASRPARDAERALGAGMPRGLAAAYACLVVALGPGSAAMHATQSRIGGHLDLTSMFLVSGFAVAYAVTRFVLRRDLRAFTRVFLVALFHVRWPHLGGGFLGVDVFFVLSGYLITTLLLRESAARGRPDLGRFWSRRVTRLMPASVVVILTVLVWTALAAPASRPASRTAAAGSPESRRTDGR